jgi:hypothetical protein
MNSDELRFGSFAPNKMLAKTMTLKTNAARGFASYQRGTLSEWT